MRQLEVNGFTFVETEDDFFYEESLSIDQEPDEDGNQWLCYQVPDGFNEKSNCIKIPNGKYEYFGRAEDLTEERWKEIVEWVSRKIPLYKNYEGISNRIDDSFLSATNSGHSLLKHNGFELSTTLILKKNKNNIT